MCAGLAAYPSWVPTLQYLCRPEQPWAVFTDYCEEAAYRAEQLIQALAGPDATWLKPTVNPFRSPLSCTGNDNRLPSYSNAFMFGMKTPQR